MEKRIETTLKHALFLSRHLNGCDPQYAVVAVLVELGIPPNQSGFDYLKKAIILRYENPDSRITKDIYPAIGKTRIPRVGSSLIERSIRYSISIAWKNRDENVWRYYFPQAKAGFFRRPSNNEFISAVACFIELWRGCCKEADYEKS